MKANDVRLKNLVKYQGKVYQIASITEEYPYLNTTEFGDGVVEWSNLQGVELTEDWLLKFGLLKFGIIYEQEKDSQFAVKNWEGKEWLVFWGDFRLVKINIKYVHELQNLYFALTGLELNITNGCMCSVLPRTYYHSKRYRQLAKLTYTTC